MAPPKRRGLRVTTQLREVFVDQFRHIKHVDSLFASENLREFFVCIDVAFVFCVLETISLDVSPEFFGHFCAWHWAFANHCSEFIADFHWLHEFGIFLFRCHGVFSPIKFFVFEILTKGTARSHGTSKKSFSVLREYVSTHTHSKLDILRTILEGEDCSHRKFVERYLFYLANFQYMTEFAKLQRLAEQLSNTSILEEKMAFLETESQWQSTDLEFSEWLKKKSPEEQFVVHQMALIGQVIGLGKDVNRWNQLLEQLVVIDRFYREMGGIVGYQAEVLRLLKEPARAEAHRYHAPVFDDISEETPEVLEAIRWGLEALPSMAELYPLGGAADRLHLVDEATGTELPAAKLHFAGHTLLETLIRDLQAREWLYFRLFDRVLETPVALMTSWEKNNHHHVLEVCKAHHWFGRSPSSFRFFIQPLVPTVNENGQWHTTGPAKLLLKPGGHGAIWKLAKDEGIFSWFQALGRTEALIRQINNPVAGLDYGLLAFTGLGWKKQMRFGFASCPRRVAAAEGMNVVVEQGSGEVALTNVEYCDFAKHGIEDKPLREGEPFSQFSSNTNILFANLAAIEAVVQKCPFPGLLVNLKKGTFTDETGTVKQAQLARLESTMQNIADVFTEPKKNDFPVKTEKTFVTYNHRHKTISVAKKAYLPGQPLSETPELCFYELLSANRELLEACGFALPPEVSIEEYLRVGPSALFLYHPALGPLYSIIRQKLRGGFLGKKSELILELAEADISNLSVTGSCFVRAESPLGKPDAAGRVHYSHAVSHCVLHDVTVVNAGGPRKPPFWKLGSGNGEALEITLKGHSAFDARGVRFEGAHSFTVEDGIRMVVRQQGETRIVRKEPLAPVGLWKYTWDRSVRLEVSGEREFAASREGN